MPRDEKTRLPAGNNLTLSDLEIGERFVVKDQDACCKFNDGEVLCKVAEGFATRSEGANIAYVGDYHHVESLGKKICSNCRWYEGVVKPDTEADDSSCFHPYLTTRPLAEGLDKDDWRFGEWRASCRDWYEEAPVVRVGPDFGCIHWEYKDD